MTPDIKGLVERLRMDAEMMKDGAQTNLTGLWHSEVVRDAAKDCLEAADALERLSTPPAVPATPVAWRWPKVLAVKRPHNRWHGELSFAEQPTDEELDNLKAFLNEHHKNAAPVPAHSDVRSKYKAACGLVQSIREGRGDADNDFLLNEDDAAEEILAFLSTTAQSGDQKETQFRKHKSTQNI